MRLPQLVLLDDQKSIYCLSGFGRPFGVNCDNRGYVYITDMDLHTVFRLSADFQKITWLTDQGWQPEQEVVGGELSPATPQSSGFLNGPHAIDFDNDNNFYVTTYYTPLIKLFNPNGEFIDSLGDKMGHYWLNGPASAFFNRDKTRLLVAEYADNALLIYDVQGSYLGGVGGISRRLTTNKIEQRFQFRRSSLQGGFDRLHMVKQGPDNLLYCADTWNNRIQILDAEGKFKAEYTHAKLKQPVSISFTANQNLLVTSWGNNSILMFDKQGNLETIFDDLQLNKPYDAQYLSPWLVIADSHNGRVLFMKI